MPVERASAFLRWSVRRHVPLLIVVTYCMFYLASSSPLRVRQQVSFKAATQDENDLRVPVTDFPTPFFSLPPLTLRSRTTLTDTT
jgi:hypothetical protein